MELFELKNEIEKIVGLRLTSIKLAFEMMMFTFEKYALHTQGLTRIIKNDDILVTTLDYLSWDRECDENNDEWYNLNKFKTVIEGGRVVSVDLNAMRDLTIVLDNDIVIQVIIQNSYAQFDEEKEQYRFFEVGPEDETEEEERKHKHYVVYSKQIEIN